MAKRKKNGIRVTRFLITILLICLLGGFSYTYINQEIVLNRQEAQIRRMQEENARLEEKYQDMLRQLDDKNTIEYIDRYMRSHFGMVQDGETRVDIVEGK